MRRASVPCGLPHSASAIAQTAGENALDVGKVRPSSTSERGAGTTYARGREIASAAGRRDGVDQRRKGSAARYGERYEGDRDRVAAHGVHP
jgi:hypothetical protein